MGYITYKQADSRWGSKNYNGSSTMAQAGCGCCAVADLAYAVDGKTNPWDVAKYMKKNGFAIRNNGTAWAGIPSAMKRFGLSDVKEINVNATMKDVWAHLSKGYCAVFLFRKGSKGGITWTTSGHYVAVTDYKLKGGKHYLYTRDSGGRNHTGWYCYETQMKGLIPKVWVGLIKVLKKPTTKYEGNIAKPKLKKGSSGTEVKRLQKFLKWYGINMKVDGDFGSVTDSGVRKFQQTEKIKIDGVYGKQSYKKALLYKKVEPKQTIPIVEPSDPVADKVKRTAAQKLIAEMDKLAWKYGTPKKNYSYKKGRPRDFCKKVMRKYGYNTKAEYSDCGNFVNSVVRHSGVDKHFTSLHAVKTPFPKHEDKFKIVISGRVPKVKELKAGDIIRYKKKGGDQHAMFYYGHNRICDAGHYNRFGNIRKNDFRYKRKNVKKSTIQVLRAK